MARQELVSYVLTCDVCHEEIHESDGGDVSRKVSFEGAEYVVDLCGIHQGELGDTLKELKVFVDAGRRSSPPGRRGRATPAVKAPRAKSGKAARQTAAAPTGSAGPSRAEVAAIRSWAQANGHKVGDRGRIPAAVVAAYGARGAETSAPVTPKRRSRKAKVAAVSQ